MNTHQLKCAIKADTEMKNVIGVYAADGLPKIKQLPCGLIVNTDPHQLPGKHWIAFYITKNGVLECFDSYGRSPSVYSSYIERYMKTFDKILVNTKQLQGLNTRVCGHYSLFYLMCRCRGFSMQEIIDIFTHDFIVNDQYVYDFINDRFYCCIYTVSGLCQRCINKI